MIRIATLRPVSSRPCWSLTFIRRRPAEVTHKETHISHVFLAGELVYKIKKAVRFSFLDFSTVANRQHFLNEELRLNRRLAPSIYLEVLPVTKTNSRFKLCGEGKALDYVLVMRRLPDEGMLPALLENNRATTEMMQELAKLLAKFHSQAERILFADPSAYPALVQKQWDTNLVELEPLAGSAIDPPALHTLREFGTSFTKRENELLIKRAKQGWIRDVHGDLHCENICFAPEGIQIFDCIEFSEEFRHCDLASEIGFLLMDMEARGGGYLAESLRKNYCALTNDSDLHRLLPFYKSYRAIVRAKVQALRADTEAAVRYVRLATRYAAEGQRSFVVIVSGLSGSGKSTLARELGKQLSIAVINSDVVRKRLAGNAGPQAVALNTGIYTPAMTERTYAEMSREAQRHVANGSGVILDATFLLRKQRQQIISLSRQCGVPLFLIHCRVPAETTKQRLFERAAAGTDVSGARWEIYIEQAAAEEPFDDFPADARLELDTIAPLEQLVSKAREFIVARLRLPQAKT